jgi:putative tryptophan/tyrosine transport system substrate-binding protein
MLCAAVLAVTPSLVAAPVAAGDAPRIAVVYPQVRDPYRAVFRAIVDGVNAETPQGAAVLEIAPEESIEAVSARLAQQKFDAVVLLGKRGLDLSSRIESPERRIVGAVFAKPDDIGAGVNAISLAPAPRMLFTKLRELAPAVKRIHVIYGADDNDWLIDLARSDAAELGYELLPLHKESIREGASAYRELLQQIESPQDAIWLLQASPFLDENSVLQMVLRAAWDRNLVVFSSNPSHVPKGALFALFPDNNAMGRHLAQQLRKPASASARLLPLEQLDTAINIRTADHLGLGLSAGDARFDMVFPNR